MMNSHVTDADALTAENGTTRREVSRLLGSLTMALGSALIGWWIATWVVVDGIIARHVATHGALPPHELLPSLYLDGTQAEQELSEGLSSISGLYPYGWTPLIMGLLVLGTGVCFAVASRRTRVIVIGAATAMTVVIALSIGDSVGTVLSILE